MAYTTADDWIFVKDVKEPGIYESLNGSIVTVYDRPTPSHIGIEGNQTGFIAYGHTNWVPAGASPHLITTPYYTVKKKVEQ